MFPASVDVYPEGKTNHIQVLSAPTPPTTADTDPNHLCTDISSDLTRFDSPQLSTPCMPITPALPLPAPML